MSQTPGSIPCENHGLTVECEHKGGGKLVLPSQRNVLQIVVGPQKKKREIKAQTKIVKGPCATHKGKVFSLEGATAKPYSDKEIAFEAVCDPRYDKITDFHNLWPYPAKTKSYVLEPRTCHMDGELRARVEAFPDIEWEISWSVGMTAERKATINTSSEINTSNKVNLASSGKIKVTTDGNTTDLAANFNTYLQKVMKIINATKNVIQYVSGALDYVGGITIQIIYPSITISGKWAYEEVKDGKADFGYEMKLALAPLIGVSGSADITDAVIRLVPYAGPVLAKIKKRAEKGVDAGGFKGKAVAAIRLTVGGQIGGSAAIKMMAGSASVSGEGKVEGKITFQVQGELSCETEFWIVKGGAGVQVGAESEISGSINLKGDERGPYHQGMIKWNGITVYATVYANGDITTKSYEGPKNSASSGKYTSQAKAGETEGSKWSRKVTHVLIKPKEWPFQKHYFLENQDSQA